MIRKIDFLLALFGLVSLMPLIILILILLYFDNQSPFFYQQRIGKNLKKFTLIKFRTMREGTIDTPSHLVDSSRITPIGVMLRKTKLDEIPQLLNVIKGEMSLVGPRPCLPSQYELIRIRKKLNVHLFLPGITGLAQIKGIDMSNPLLLANTDREMIKNFNLNYYFYFIFKTITGNGLGDRVNKNKII